MITQVTETGTDQFGQSFKVGDKMIEGFSIVYVQRLFGKSATTSLDRKGIFTASKRVDQSYLLVATEERLAVIADYEILDKEETEARKGFDKRRRELSARLGRKN